MEVGWRLAQVSIRLNSRFFLPKNVLRAAVSPSSLSQTYTPVRISLFLSQVIIFSTIVSMRMKEPHVVGIEVVHSLVCGVVLHDVLLVVDHSVVGVEGSLFVLLVNW